MTKKQSRPENWRRRVALFLTGPSWTSRVKTRDANAAKVTAYRLRIRHRKDPIRVRAEGVYVIFERKGA